MSYSTFKYYLYTYIIKAEASREARAKIIASEGEQKASRALREASEIIGDSPAALQLRYLQVLLCAVGKWKCHVVNYLTFLFARFLFPLISMLCFLHSCFYYYHQQSDAECNFCREGEMTSIYFRQFLVLFSHSVLYQKVKFLFGFSQNSTIIFPLPIDMMTFFMKKNSM